MGIGGHRRRSTTAAARGAQAAEVREALRREAEQIEGELLPGDPKGSASGFSGAVDGKPARGFPKAVFGNGWVRERNREDRVEERAAQAAERADQEQSEPEHDQR